MSLEHLHLIARVRTHAASSPQPPAIALGLRVSHIVACPCVQQMVRHARRVATGAAEAAPEIVPPLTHSQRCVTTLLACGLAAPFQVRELLAQLDAVICRTQSTLPRGRELALVFRAHRTPQFIEDALRESLWALFRTLDGPHAFTRLIGHARSAEAIHAFDLRASATLRPEDVVIR
jgi:GTP cyclohydrolase FolE2